MRSLLGAVSELELLAEEPAIKGNDTLNGQWSGLIKDLRTRADLPNRPAHIAVWGETGTGKSTLLNTLLGVEVLPAEGAPQSTTSKTVELAYREGPGFEVKVFLRTKEEWKNHRVQVASVCHIFWLHAAPGTFFKC